MPHYTEEKLVYPVDYVLRFLRFTLGQLNCFGHIYETLNAEVLSSCQIKYSRISYSSCEEAKADGI
jgi:hypothetical protein